MSKIQSESNSQQGMPEMLLMTAVFNMSKIQSESNSQPCADAMSQHISCVQYVKDTI